MTDFDQICRCRKPGPANPNGILCAVRRAKRKRITAERLQQLDQITMTDAVRNELKLLGLTDDEIEELIR